MSVDEIAYRKLYPEWVGGTGPLFSWLTLLIILISIPLLFYLFENRIQYHILAILKKIRHKNNPG